MKRLRILSNRGAAFKEQSKQKNAKKASDQRKRKAAEKRTAERAASVPLLHSPCPYITSHLSPAPEIKNWSYVECFELGTRAARGDTLYPYASTLISGREAKRQGTPQVAGNALTGSTAAAAPLSAAAQIPALAQGLPLVLAQQLAHLDPQQQQQYLQQMAAQHAALQRAAAQQAAA